MDKDLLVNLIDQDTLKTIMLTAKKIDKNTSKEQMYVEFEKWLQTKRSFSRSIRTLSDESLDGFNNYLKQQFENLTIEESNYSMDYLDRNLQEYLISNSIEKNKKKSGILDKLLKEREEHEKAEKKKNSLSPMSFNEFMNKEDNKEYFVKNMFAKGTINMIYSPPACMKSFVSYYLGLCLATGKPFLNQKTKKVNVGYFDWENPLSDIQNRVKGICKGMELDMSSIDNFYFFNKQPSLLRVSSYDSHVCLELKEELLLFIKENKIKVLFFDTLRRLGNFDENDSGAINTIKADLFDELINEHNVCIIFLHHTSKEGKQYRGSVDIEGILDTAFSIDKKVSEDNTSITITNTKRRNNELEILSSFVEIENESYEDEEEEMYEKIINVKFSKKQEEVKPETDYSGPREYFINNLEIGRQYKNKELIEILTYNFDGMSSSATTTRVLKFLEKIDILKSFGERKNKYYILNPTYANKDQQFEIKELNKHFIKLFETNDYVRISDLKDKFEEKYFSLIVNEWNQKGWLNSSKKDYLGITDLFVAENRKLNVEEVNVK